MCPKKLNAFIPRDWILIFMCFSLASKKKKVVRFPLWSTKFPVWLGRDKLTQIQVTFKIFENIIHVFCYLCSYIHCKCSFVLRLFSSYSWKAPKKNTWLNLCIYIAAEQSWYTIVWICMSNGWNQRSYFSNINFRHLSLKALTITGNTMNCNNMNSIYSTISKFLWTKLKIVSGQLFWKICQPPWF